jgi:hypothetical protein
LPESPACGADGLREVCITVDTSPGGRYERKNQRANYAESPGGKRGAEATRRMVSRTIAWAKRGLKLVVTRTIDNTLPGLTLAAVNPFDPAGAPWWTDAAQPTPTGTVTDASP